MRNGRLLRDTLKVLERHGFASVQLENVRSCFDIVAKRKGNMMLLKIVENIDSIDDKTAKSIATLNDFFGTSAFAVGSGYKGGRLSEGIAFSRHGISCISLETMGHVMDGEAPANAERFLGAKYKIDGGILAAARRKRGMSMHELSEATGISVNSIYRYENQSTYVSLGNWRKLEHFFGSDIRTVREYNQSASEHHEVPRSKGSDSGIGMLEMESGPFKMIGKMKFRYEAGQITDRKTLRKRAEVYARIHELTERDFPFFISEKASIESIFGIPVISRDELRRISEEKELKEKLMERAPAY